MSNPQTKEKPEKDKKVRVFALAKELNVETKTLLEFAKELGFAEIKNQLSGLAPEQADALKARAKSGPKAPAAKTSAPGVPSPPAKPVIPVAKDNRIQTLPKAKPTPKPVEPTLPAVATPPAPVAPSVPAPVVELPEPEAPPAEPEHETPAVAARAANPSRSTSRGAQVPPPPPAPPQNVIPNFSGGGMRNLPGRMQNLNAPAAYPQPPRPTTPSALLRPAATARRVEAVSTSGTATRSRTGSQHPRSPRHQRLRRQHPQLLPVRPQPRPQPRHQPRTSRRPQHRPRPNGPARPTSSRPTPATPGVPMF
ncbi:MAG: translation initiation factor IF-2 N-terminal domain-containing protein [Gemmataceae bacterium]